MELLTGKPNGLAMSVAFCDSPSSWSCGAVLAALIGSAALTATAELVSVPVLIAEDATGLKLKTAIARRINVNLVFNSNTWPVLTHFFGDVTQLVAMSVYLIHKLAGKHALSVYHRCIRRSVLTRPQTKYSECHSGSSTLDSNPRRLWRGLWHTQ